MLVKDRLTAWIGIIQNRFRAKAPIAKITLLLLGATVFGFCLDKINFPVAWLLGPMILGISYALNRGSPQPLPKLFSTVGKSIIGVATAARFSLETLATATNYALPLLLCIFITGSLSLFNGYLLERWAGINRATGFLGSTPGAASAIVAMSEEMGADAIAVSVLQYVRVAIVVLFIPLAASLLFPANSITQVQATTTIYPTSGVPIPISWNLLILAVCAIIGVWGGSRLRLPASPFLGPFLVGLIAFSGLPYQLQIPPILFAGGLLVFGLFIGLKFDFHTVRKLFKAVLIEVVLVIVLSLICLGVGYGFHLVTDVNVVTAVLSFTPGGIEAMIATVVQLGGDVGLVVMAQMTRMLIVLLLSPWLVSFALKSAAKANFQKEKD